MRSFELGETIVLHRRTPQVIGGQRQYDAYGNLSYVETVETLTGVAIFPETTSEALQFEDRTTTIYVVALPADVALSTIDRVTWNGLDYEIQGQPQLFRSPLTGSSLQQFRIVRTEG